MPNFFFQRYVHGERMADDVLITKQPTLEAAIPEALRLCRNSPKSVLVYVPEDNALSEEITRLREENARLREALIDTTASLVASVSLLERGGKKAAPSDKMFAQMLVDYKNSIDRARASLEGVTEPQQSGEENARLREQINSAYDKGRESRGKVVAAGHALFVYAQKVTHKIKHHSLEKLFPLPDSELLAFIEAVNESSKSERARAAIREGGKDD